MLIPKSWRPLEEADAPPNVIAELRAEHPNVQVLRDWILAMYAEQRGLALRGPTAPPDQSLELAAWMAFQAMESDFNVILRRWPRPDYLLFATNNEKISTLAQRHCRICHGSRPVSDRFPKYNIPIRIPPISRQASKASTFKAFQAAIKHRIAKRDFDLKSTDRFCMKLTFVLDLLRRDKDLDNMTKALQDAFARALGFDDVHIQHLDVAKLRFPSAEEFVYVGLSRSFLNEHENVLAPVFNHTWAGQEVLNLASFLAGI